MTSGCPTIQWPELKLLQEPYRHYVLMPKRIPIQWSVSSIAKGRSDTDPLINWAAKLIVKEYEESGCPKKAVKAAKKELEWSGTFGTLVHDTIEANLTGDPHLPGDRPVDKSLSESDVKKAALAVVSALTWLRATGLEVVEVERKVALSVPGANGQPIWAAGTFDLLCRDGRGRWHLIDWKTSGAIRTKMFVQGGGYAEAAAALGIEISSFTICRLPRSGGVEVATTTQVGAFRELFCEELRLHQRYHDAKFHVDACKANELTLNQASGGVCSGCQSQSRYITETLCVPCYAKQIINESETKND